MPRKLLNVKRAGEAKRAREREENGTSRLPAARPRENGKYSRCPPGCFMKFNKYETNLPRVPRARTRQTSTGTPATSRPTKRERILNARFFRVADVAPEITFDRQTPSRRVDVPARKETGGEERSRGFRAVRNKGRKPERGETVPRRRNSIGSFAKERVRDIRRCRSHRWSRRALPARNKETKSFVRNGGGA